ncbi:hypothetical protein D9M68_647250 [compost metagenome]
MSYEKDDTYLFVHPQKTKKTSSVKSDFSITYKFTANANILSGTMNAEAPNIFDDGGGLINELLFNTSSIDFNANQVVSVHVSGGAIYIQGNQSPTSLWCYPRDKFLIITIKYQDNPSTNLTYNLINAAINADPTGSFVIN